MHKKHHEKFKILGILAVTTQAREGIETDCVMTFQILNVVTTQAREGIETTDEDLQNDKPFVTTQAREGIETLLLSLCIP